ncbi:MAG: ABC transporter permease [Anaerolineae bacterium]|nr:ABC transporter permease [Gemmatimonadaceae bacterium]
MATNVTSDSVTLPVIAAPEFERAGGTPNGVPVVTIDGSTHWRQWWVDLFLYRGALQSLMWRNVRSRYKQAVLGIAWAVIQPTMQVVVFTVLFGRLASVPSGGVPYPLFALAGLLPWNLFAKIINDGAVSLVANQHIITKLFFPRIYLVLAVGASALLDTLVTLIALVALMLWYGVAPGLGVLFAIPALIGMLVLSYGLAALLAAINARWRDVQHTLPFLMQVALFATPVLYQTSYLPSRWRFLLALNPATGFIEIFRGSMLGMGLPETRIIGISIAMSSAAIIAGVWYFTRSEATIVDVV